MMPRDLASQIRNANAGARFRGSAAERELVKGQIKLGRSPIEIESKERVERRAEHLGIKKEAAAAFAREVKSAAGTREARATPHPRNPGLERIIGGDDLLSSVFLERGAEAAKSVCCILEREFRIGTGFLVAPRVLLTNAHVIPDKETAEICSADFNFEDKVNGNGMEGAVRFKLAPQELFISSPEEELDYTLVAVESASGAARLDEFAFLKLDAAVGKVLRGECLNIIQHPNGAAKRVALRQNRFTALLERFMHYEADTMPGSSGSPVFNDQWQVVCLHHAGVPLKDSQGRILTKDNRVWDGDNDDPVLIKWIGNEGVRISRIIADVARQVGSRRHKLLSDFPRPAENPPNTDEQLVDWQDDSSINQDGRRRAKSLPQAGSAGSSKSVTVPLTLTLTVGETGSAVRVALAGNDKADKQHDSPDAEPGVEPAKPETLVQRGLRNLERSQTRTYYDEAQDQQDRAVYY
ncbi:MAG: serine protease, partial [Acidobacteriales bacterium]|nr:serine protease [Terriglobales bacterium]